MVAGILARLLAVAAGAAAFTFASRDLDAVAVRGRSMAPALLPGDRLIVRRRRGEPRVGEVVVVRDPRRPDRELIKRVAAVDGGPGHAPRRQPGRQHGRARVRGGGSPTA